MLQVEETTVKKMVNLVATQRNNAFLEISNKLSDLQSK